MSTNNATNITPILNLKKVNISPKLVSFSVKIIFIVAKKKIKNQKKAL